MLGKKVPVEVVEEVKALSLVYSAKAISEKVHLGMRTVYNILAKKDSPAVEAKRDEMRVDVVERMWANKDKEILQLKDKMDLLMDGVNEEKINRAGVRDTVGAYGILFDERQLLSGGPTQNIFSLTAILERLNKDEKGKPKQEDNGQQQEQA